MPMPLMNAWKSFYYDIFQVIQADLQAVSSIGNVVLGEHFKITSLPMAIINPEHTDIKQATFGSFLECRINFSIILMIRETEPANWFTDIIGPMGDVMDAVLKDRTFGDNVKDTTPTLFSPGEIRTQGKLYYGGVLRFQSLMYFTPDGSVMLLPMQFP